MTDADKETFTEKIQVAGEDLVTRVKELIAEGNVRRVVLLNDQGKVLLKVPMNLGAAVGGVAVLTAPFLTMLGVVAGLLARVTIEIERTGPRPTEEIIVEVEETIEVEEPEV